MKAVNGLEILCDVCEQAILDGGSNPNEKCEGPFVAPTSCIDRRTNVHAYHSIRSEHVLYGTGNYSDGQYTQPLSKEVAKMTGCYAEFGKYPLDATSDKGSAIKSAVSLYGYALVDDFGEYSFVTE